MELRMLALLTTMCGVYFSPNDNGGGGTGTTGDPPADDDTTPDDSPEEEEADDEDAKDAADLEKLNSKLSPEEKALLEKVQAKALDAVKAATKTQTAAEIKADAAKAQRAAATKRAQESGDLKKQNELLTATNKELETKLAEADARQAAADDLELRRQVCIEAKIDPDQFAKRLQGKNKAEYVADAKGLAKIVPGKETRPDLEGGARRTKTTTATSVETTSRKLASKYVPSL